MNELFKSNENVHHLVDYSDLRYRYMLKKEKLHAAENVKTASLERANQKQTQEQTKSTDRTENVSLFYWDNTTAVKLLRSNRSGRKLILRRNSSTDSAANIWGAIIQEWL